MRFEVDTVMNMSVLVFCVVTPREHVGRYQHFGRTFATLYKLSTSQQPHFIPESGGRTFLHHVGLYI
jgi:hypothetical protein